MSFIELLHLLANHATKHALWKAPERHHLQEAGTKEGKRKTAATSLGDCTAAQRGLFIHSQLICNVTARRRMEDPIGVPYGGPYSSAPNWNVPLEGPIYCMQRALLRAPHVEHSLENSRGPNLKGKQQKSKRKNPSLPKCRQEQNHPDFCWCYFQQCARLNMCFK